MPPALSWAEKSVTKKTNSNSKRAGEQVHKNCHSLPWTPMNRNAKFYAASFILGEEIRNRTKTENKHTHTHEQ